MHHRCFLSGGEIVPEQGNLVEELEMLTVLVDSVKIFTSVCAYFVLNTLAESLHYRHGAYQNNFLSAKILITLNFQVELGRTTGIHSFTASFRVVFEGI